MARISLILQATINDVDDMSIDIYNEPFKVNVLGNSDISITEGSNYPINAWKVDFFRNIDHVNNLINYFTV